MPDSSTIKTGARWVVYGALFLIPFTPLLVVNSFFFPFITGKAFYFRILVEVAVAAWALLALMDKAYRPRFSWVGVAVVAFVLWMAVADAFAVNVLKAFWSNFERMEGWVLLIHLLGLFFVMSGFLRAEGKWRAWFLWSLSASVLVVIWSFFQLFGLAAIHQGATRIDATLGNSAYLAIYFLFNVFLASWLALTETRPWLKYALITLAVIEAVLIFFTETRGTIIGLVGGIMLCTFLFAVSSPGRVRRIALGSLATLIVLIGIFIGIRHTSFVQNNDILQRLASISAADGTVRFTLWGMAFKGFEDRPVTGWGQEGFNYVFNKYYQPSLYAQESWFDRAHNAFIDWLIAGGAPAFLLYVLLFVSALFALWRSGLAREERILLTGALVGYAFHNLFVFDNLYSYVYFFAILALIDSQVGRPFRRFEEAPGLSAQSAGAIALPVALIACAGVIYFVNIPGITVASGLITALSPSSSGIEANIAEWQKLAAHPSFAAQEVREQIVSFAVQAANAQGVSDTDKKTIEELALSEMQKQVASYPEDARERLELAFAYSINGDPQDALAQMEIAHQLSPGKEQILIQEGVTFLDAGDVADAEKEFAAAYALGPQFPDLAAYAAAGDFLVGNKAAGNALLLKSFGTTTVDNDALALAYYHTGNFPALIALWKLRVAIPNAPVDSYFGLAAAYFYAGDKADAISIVRAGIAAHPDAADTGNAIISQIQSAK